MYKETKGPGLTSLPSARGKGKPDSQVWHIFREFRKLTHYYHRRPFNKKDILIKSNINPAKGIELVNEYNRKAQDAKNNKVPV